MQEINNPIEACLRYIYQTNESIFLTGKAGTGKTTLLKKILAESPKNTVVVAPTGIAALNANGVTIHSMFHLPFGTFLPSFEKVFGQTNVKLENRHSLARHFRYNKTKAKLLRELELLIIDEVSMLRADVLDAIDWALKTVRHSNLPFGGVQVLYIGDLLQLPPVMKHDEWRHLSQYYNGIYFFNALVLQNNQPVYIELEKIHRQSDEQFINILNELRNNQLSKESIEVLNQRYQPNFTSNPKDNFITLTSHNRIADEMNSTALRKLDTKEITFKAIVKGDFPESIYPNDNVLLLKKGAQVMFIKNDSSYEKQYYNGKIGIVSSIGIDEIKVYLPEDKKEIFVERSEWENIKYTINEDTNEIKEKVVGTYVQFPLRLAWSITIHKSQGLTFDKAVLDVAQVFAAGQAYVALSRLRSLEGLILKSPFNLNGIENDRVVTDYSNLKKPISQLNENFSKARLSYLQVRLISAFDWSSLESRWRKHLAFYKELTDKSEKGKNLLWAKEQFESVKSIVDVSSKFVVQLKRLFNDSEADLKYIDERVGKAYNHFYTLIDSLNYQVLRKRFELLRLKRVKEFQEELEDLDEAQLKLMLEMKKVKLLFQAIVNNQPIQKTSLQSDDIQTYRKNKFLQIQKDLEQEKNTLGIQINPDEEWKVSELLQNKSIKKEKSAKVPKTPTHLLTFELYQKGMSIADIANERMFTEETIFGHLAKLALEGKIELNELLNDEKRNLLEQKLTKKDLELPLGEMKNIVGDLATFSELRLYRDIVNSKVE